MDYKAELLRTVPNMNGWCHPDKANHVFDTTYNQNAKLCVELGVFAGRSLIAFALALAKRAAHDNDKDRKVIGIDTWSPQPAMENNDGENAKWWRAINYEEIKQEAVNTVARLEVSEFVELVHDRTHLAWANVDGPIDILHIDGNHSQWDSTRDVTMWVDKVREGGIIYFDDEDWATTKAAQELLLLKCDKVSEIKSSNVCGVYQKRAGGNG